MFAIFEGRLCTRCECFVLGRPQRGAEHPCQHECLSSPVGLLQFGFRADSTEQLLEEVQAFLLCVRGACIPQPEKTICPLLGVMLLGKVASTRQTAGMEVLVA